MAGPDLRFEVKAEDLVRSLVEPGAAGLWRRREQATNAPIFERSGCYITGRFDLRAADLDFLLRFKNCRFEYPPDVREAKLLGLSFDSCWLPGLRARNLRSKNDVRLIDSKVAVRPDSRDGSETTIARGHGHRRGMPNAAVNLTDAVIEGSVVFSRSEIHYPTGKAIHADRLDVTGAVLAYRLRTDGEVRVPGMRTGGNVNFSGAQLRNPSGFALNGTGVHIGGSLLCEPDQGADNEEPRQFAAEGPVFIPGARIAGDVVLRGSELIVNPDGPIAVEGWKAAMASADPAVDPWPAIVADRLRVEGNLECGDGFTSTGTLRIVNAVIGGSLRLAGAKITVRRREQEPYYDRALHLDGSEISGDVQAARLDVAGQLRLADVTVGGNLLARHAVLHHPGRDVFSARRSRVSGNVDLAYGTVAGTVQLQGITVGGNVELYDTQLTEPQQRRTRSYSVDVRTARIGRDLLCSRYAADGFLAEGGVNLEGAKVARRINFHGARLRSLPEPEGQRLPGQPPRLRGIALDASDVVADEIILTPHEKPQGRVILRRALCATLDDNPEFWRATKGIELEDFRYDALRNPIDLRDDPAVDERIERLRQAMRGYRPGPYDQLAAVLRASGNEEHASTVLLRKQQYRYDALSTGARFLGPGVRLWSWTQRAMVGYGYRPMRALGWLVALLVIGSVWFGLGMSECPPGIEQNGPRCPINVDDLGLEWNPVLYTTDLLVPIVDFGNKNRWFMSGADKWVATAFTAMGWVLATTVAAGITRMLRRP
ncbi:MAG: oxidoreductase [Haloechinothrix sp.]